jgi:hypothetical protein
MSGVWAGGGGGRLVREATERVFLLMPNNHNADRRHYFGKMKFKVRNWVSYEVGLRRRGNLTFWVTDEAIAIWQAPPRETSYRFSKLRSRF